MLAQSCPTSRLRAGLALSVCAGSSLFLTAATSGPMAQALTERAQLTDSHGHPLHFGFAEFLPIGFAQLHGDSGIAIGYGWLFTR